MAGETIGSAPAAVTAVQQWKSALTTVSGEPVDVQAKVYVVFELNRQQKILRLTSG